MIKIGNDWDYILQKESEKTYYLELRSFLKKEYAHKVIYPQPNEIFSALKYTSYKDTCVVILGQDPYINKGEAHGMAFSVNIGCKIPPSLKNIFAEIKNDLGYPIPDNGYLINWAMQGVLLLNTILTVEAGRSRSHAGKGWEKFTDYIIETLSKKESPVVFLLWGNSAKQKSSLIDKNKHKILVATHPSPLAGGKFFGCKHFSKTNDYLKSIGKDEINWGLH